MSQIEVCSRFHTGKVIVTTLQGEKEVVEFKQVEPRLFVAVVSEDAAEILLGKLGAPDYFKLGPVDLGNTVELVKSDAPEDSNTPAPEEDDAPDETPEALTAEGYAAITNVGKLKATLEGCDNKELLMELVAAEIGADKPRKSYIEALNARIDALTVQA